MFIPRQWTYLISLIILGLALLSCEAQISTNDDSFDKYLQQSGTSSFSCLLRNATIVDGLKTPAYHGDLLINHDTVAFIGKVDTQLIWTDQIIDLQGHYLTPGFIDPHAHGDPLEDTFHNFLAMGVTTLLLGQDGRSPVNDPSYEDPENYFKIVSKLDLPLNIAFLSGHGSIRSKLVHGRKISDGEIAKMANEVSRSMQAGCFGMSTGLEYHPGIYATDQELLVLAREIGKRDGLIMSHMRSEDDEKLNESIQELMRQGAHCRVHISHLKSVYGRGSIRAEEVIATLKNAVGDGIRISADAYPYNASYTGIGIVFPNWAKTRTDFELAARTRNGELRRHLEAVVMRRNGPDATLFATGPFTGKTLAQVAEASQQHFVDVLMRLGPIGASGAYFVMDESLQSTFINHPDIMICTDGGPKMRHPRGYGTHAKILSRYVRDKGSIALEDAVFKMSHLPASTIGLEKRGSIQIGATADLISFDLKNVADLATFEDPFRLAVGIDLVFISGKLVKKGSKILDESQGKLVRKSYN